MKYMYKNELGWQTEKYREYVDLIWSKVNLNIREIMEPSTNGLNSLESWHDAMILDVKVDTNLLVATQNKDPDSSVSITLKLSNSEVIKLEYVDVEEADIPLTLNYNSISEIYVHELVIENKIYRHEFAFVGFGFKPWVIKSKKIKLHRL